MHSRRRKYSIESGGRLESKPRLRLLRLRSSDYGGNLLRYNFGNSVANKRVFLFHGLDYGFRVMDLGLEI